MSTEAALRRESKVLQKSVNRMEQDLNRSEKKNKRLTQSAAKMESELRDLRLTPRENGLQHELARLKDAHRTLGNQTAKKDKQIALQEEKIKALKARQATCIFLANDGTLNDGPTTYIVANSFADAEKLYDGELTTLTCVAKEFIK
jgi:chromosome segregation ATPase